MQGIQAAGLNGGAADAERAAVADAGVERAYWLCQLGGWGALTVFNVWSSTAGSWDSVLRFAAAKTTCMVFGFALSHWWRLHLRERGWLHGSGAFPVKRFLAWLLALALVQTGVLVLSDQIFRDGRFLTDEPDAVPRLVVAVFFLWFGVFLVWTLCYAFAQSRRRATRFELEKLELEVSVKDAELRALQAQINPHFFFNSLNSIRALIYQDAAAAARAVGQLAGMMRHSLQAGQADTVRLADELAAVDAYLGMEKLRFDERLHLTVDVPDALLEVALPPMALQTLVENAVKHGVERSMEVCELRIAARRVDDMVEISIANQGQLAAASASTRLGLVNTSKRLALLFGPRATCTLSAHDGWVVARITLPQETA
ncbi:sensor histidine kinase [Massilia glaciei]|uniref:Sensor histidine kinase n=1 Tax=Massilia glaciei TaxID=1524097 RepID=A0A2U2HGQ2_9BURK|nr:histidine kinase [Massilia glaciei]PWF44371.1 sensor histidine kinase [Massilia glaciei]